MGQQPNIELEISDLPRPVPTTAPARRWKPSRPGELQSPQDMPWGGPFGTAGPDAGYALRLVANRELPLGEAECYRNIEAAMLAVVAARASYFRRAPIDEDVDVALLIFGLDPVDLPSEVVDEMAALRANWLTNIRDSDAKARALVASIPSEVLVASPAKTRARIAAGERLIDL